MNKYFYLLAGGIGLFTSFCLIGCQKAESIRVSAPKPEKKLVGYTGGNNSLNRIKVVRLYKDTVYVLSEQFDRKNGEQLVIDAGTLIKVDAGGQLLSIVIQQGGIILANGSADDPIVFTSNSLPGDQRSNWGGLIINGKSVNNLSNPNGDRTDFSGSLNYVRIEFAGLVLNQVGSRTSIDNVQVSYSNPQSSFGIHGGSFNARNLVSYACGGPADFYLTKGYSGKMQYLLAYRHPFFGSAGFNPDNALAGMHIENNPPGNQLSATPYTFPIISNLTVLGPNAQNGSVAAYGDTNTLRSAALITTRSTGFRIRNSLLMGFPGAAWYLDDSLTATGLIKDLSELTYTILHSNNGSRVFYLHPDAYRPVTPQDFRNIMLDSHFKNIVFEKAGDFMFSDPFYYENPNPLPMSNSSVLGGAGFDGPSYSDPFFTKVNFKGALGEVNWLKGWTNFTPLKTAYNVPR